MGVPGRRRRRWSRRWWLWTVVIAFLTGLFLLLHLLNVQTKDPVRDGMLFRLLQRVGAGGAVPKDSSAP